MSKDFFFKVAVDPIPGWFLNEKRGYIKSRIGNSDEHVRLRKIWLPG